MMNLIYKDITKYIYIYMSCFIFAGHELSYTKKYSPYMNCDNMMDFVICLKNCKILAQKKKPCIVVSLHISVLLQQCITSSQINQPTKCINLSDLLPVI
jgi:hypothetical protein